MPPAGGRSQLGHIVLTTRKCPPGHLAIQPASWSGHRRRVRPVSRSFPEEPGCFIRVSRWSRVVSRARCVAMLRRSRSMAVCWRTALQQHVSVKRTALDSTSGRSAVGLQPQRIGNARGSQWSAALASMAPGVESIAIRSDGDIASANQRRTASAIGAAVHDCGVIGCRFESPSRYTRRCGSEVRRS